MTCFGYLGYKNARFGRIEAHEAVNAYGREVLLRPRNSSRRAASVCCTSTSTGCGSTSPAPTSVPITRRCWRRSTTKTGLQISLEGVYRWLAFLPSRTEPRVAVANRYFGAFEDRTLKVRGIEARRRDTPRFIKETQLEMLEILARGRRRRRFPRQCCPKRWPSPAVGCWRCKRARCPAGSS